MFAVIKTGGKQYRVAANDVLTIEKLEGAAGDTVEFTEVLMVGEGAGATVGAPLVDGAMVVAEVVEQGRARKVLAFKKPKGEPDDLTTIKGIGPVAAGQLNEQGITTFAQIAKLSDNDIARIDEAMPFSADQISDWRDQAKALAK